MLSWCYQFVLVIILLLSSTIILLTQHVVNSSSYNVIIRSHHHHKVGVVRSRNSISSSLTSLPSLSSSILSSSTTSSVSSLPKILYRQKATCFISLSQCRQRQQQQQQQQQARRLPFQQQQRRYHDDDQRQRLQQRQRRRLGKHHILNLARINNFNNNNNKQSKDSRWDGDDIRLFSKLWRNIKRILKGGNNIQQRQLCYTIVITNIILYCYQLLNTIYMIRSQYPYQWSHNMFRIISDCIIGSAKPGPLTLDLVHHSYYSMIQPHRFISSGFIHGGILHLLANMSSLLSLPLWLENGLSPLLYITTYLLSIIGGNVFDVLMNIDNSVSQSYALGASGGICGLYGLMYICLVRMGNNTAALRILKGMGLLLVYGIIFTHISNTAHIGGFLSGILVGIICGPFYERSYILKRKNSLQYETLSREYRNIIGYDKKPALTGYISTSVLLISIISIVLLSNQSKYIILIPQMIIQSILHPGTVSFIIGIKF